MISGEGVPRQHPTPKRIANHKLEKSSRSPFKPGNQNNHISTSKVHNLGLLMNTTMQSTMNQTSQQFNITTKDDEGAEV